MLSRRIDALQTIVRSGTVRRVLPTSVEADGPSVPIGTLCAVERQGDGAATDILAEVIRVDEQGVVLVPYEQTARLCAGAKVRALSDRALLPVGDAFLGRAVGALGEAIDGEVEPVAASHVMLDADPPGPLERANPRSILHTGIRAIDGLLTLGKGQRIGIFAASGVGKTSLMTQLFRQVEADRVVICLVGERGREVESIWNASLSAETRKRMALVAATSDQAAAVRVRAVHQALALASHWRAEGRHVLFVLDSITRLAMALREMGLAAGEPPTVRAYTPSVFAAIPRVVEQCGALQSGGSISAIMTVLSETDDVDDPISELMKSLLDGHIVLSREMAERGHFPAIDPLRSVSRNAEALVSPEQRMLARTVQSHIAKYEQSRALIESGLYNAGSNAEIDAAIGVMPRLAKFLQQGLDEAVSFDSGFAALSAALGS